MTSEAILALFALGGWPVGATIRWSFGDSDPNPILIRYTEDGQWQDTDFYPRNSNAELGFLTGYWRAEFVSWDPSHTPRGYTPCSSQV